MTPMASAYESSFSIPSDTSRSAEIQDEIIAKLTERNFSDRDLFAVRLALEEGIVNAIKHGNDYSADKQVHISYRISADVFSIRIEDEGDGFSPEDVPDPTLDENLDRPSGRGVMLMKSFMNTVEYKNNGTVLVLEKVRTEPE